MRARLLPISRNILIVLGILLVAVPMLLVMESDTPFSETASHALLTASVVCFIFSITANVLIPREKGKNNYVFSIGLIFGLCLVAIGFWL